MLASRTAPRAFTNSLLLARSPNAVARSLSIALSLTLAATGCSLGADEGAGSSEHAQEPCLDGPCTTPANQGSPPTATDGVKNGDETDVDCGGASGITCADGKSCRAAADCASDVCATGTCQPPRPDDGVKNGDETDKDCGGALKTTPRCAAGLACKVHADCKSDGCGYDGKCAVARSCAGHFGGDTCGVGEVGAPGAQHESCCAAAPISSLPNKPLIDKYVVTAGRFRQFVERTGGNLRAFAETIVGNADWQPSWNEQLPTNIAETNYFLGPTGHTPRAGCDLGGSNGRTYWMSDAENKALGEPNGHLVSKDELDQKALNCVEFAMLQAFCIWDGGRLVKQSEFEAAWQAGEQREYPWGGGWDPSKVIWGSNYAQPEIYDKGNWVYVGAPGRRPAGNGKFGHADLAGLVFELTSDVNGQGQVNWSGSGSWEGHGATAQGRPYGWTVFSRAYWAVGGRCARPE